jgi:hypothetical protein
MAQVDPITPNTYPYPDVESVEERREKEIEEVEREREEAPPEDRPYESWDDDLGRNVDVTR